MKDLRVAMFIWAAVLPKTISADVLCVLGFAEFWSFWVSGISFFLEGPFSCAPTAATAVTTTKVAATAMYMAATIPIILV